MKQRLISFLKIFGLKPRFSDLEVLALILVGGSLNYTWIPFIIFVPAWIVLQHFQTKTYCVTEILEKE